MTGASANDLGNSVRFQVLPCEHSYRSLNLTYTHHDRDVAQLNSKAKEQELVDELMSVRMFECVLTTKYDIQGFKLATEYAFVCSKLHSSAVATLSELRRRFWVLQRQKQVSAALCTCRPCRKDQAIPCSQPVESILPEYRL